MLGQLGLGQTQKWNINGVPTEYQQDIIYTWNCEWKLERKSKRPYQSQ
jgi:hypothetical protein